MLGGVLAMIDNYPGGAVVKVALWLCPRLFVRPGELRTMRWGDVDLANREWRYTVPKTGQPHIVPLARQVVEKLEWVREISGRGEWVLPSLRNMNKPISNMALTAALRSMGLSGDMVTAHGFRATARTLLDEILGFRIDIIEHQLAHTVKDALGRAYNRTQFLKERHELMQKWADYLDELREKYGI
jgi:integrase